MDYLHGNKEKRVRRKCCRALRSYNHPAVIRSLSGGSVNPSETGTQLQQRKGQQCVGTVGIWGVKENRRDDLPHKTVIDTGNTQLTSRMSQQAKHNSKEPKSFQGKRTNAESCL